MKGPPLLSVILLGVFMSCAVPSYETGTSVVGPEIDVTRKIGEHVVRTYPTHQDSLWSQFYLYLEERGYVIGTFDKPNGFISTDWATEKYPRDATPADFSQKVAKYTIPKSLGNPEWNGFRYRYRIQIIGITTKQSRALIEAQPRAFSWDGSQTWVGLRSNGTLEELLFANFNAKFGYDSSVVH